MSPIRRAIAALACLFASGDAGAGDCPEAIGVERLGQLIGKAEVALMEIDDEAFTARMSEAGADLPCMTEPITPPLAARYHRLLALRAFAREDDVTSYREFTALVTLEPGRDLPVEFAPPGHPARALFERARAGDWSGTRAVARPSTGAVWVDGTRADGVPTRRPYLFQYVPPSGVPAVTSLVGVGDPPPTYPTAPSTRHRSARTPLLVVAAVALAGSGASYAVAGTQHAAFWDADTPYWDVLAHRSAANAAVGVSGGLLGVALITGVAGLAAR